VVNSAWKLGRIGGPDLIHVFKTVLAVIAASGISMRLELAAPRTATVTVVILMMHRHSGMVIARGVYRALGMLIGNLAAMFLIASLVQERVLFLLALSVWIGLCVCGAAYYRNYQSYGFVLAGYATCIAALPSIDDPYAIFGNVVTGLSEVLLGVVCASVVSALILPESVREMLYRTGERHLDGFLAFIRSTLTAHLSPDELGSSYLRLLGERAQLESLRSAAVFEDPELRVHNDSMTLLARRFLDASARFHSLHHFRLRLHAMPDTRAAEAIDGLCTTVAALVPTATLAGADMNTLESFARELDRWTRMRTLNADARRMTIADVDRPSQQYFESGAILLEAAVKSLRLYLAEFIAIRRPAAALASTRGTRPPRMIASANRVVAAAAGVRAIAVIATVSLFWIVSGWTGASGAVSAAAIASALYSVMPAPVQAVRQAIIGCCLSWLASLFFNFYLLPRVDGFAELALALTPFIAFGSYLNRLPITAGIGLAFNLYFCFLGNLTNPAVYTPTIALDAGFSTLLGIAVASLGYAIVAPYGGNWVTGLYLRQLRRLVAKDACHGPLPGLMQRFDSHLRDFIPQIAARPPAGKLGQGELLTWLFASMEIGRAMIDVREMAQNPDLPSSWLTAEKRLRTSISEAFQFSSASICEDAAKAAGEALATLRGRGTELHEDPVWLANLRASLTFIGVALQDNLVPLYERRIAVDR